MADDVPYQSLYRRYRPQRFAEVRGQEHVVKALQNAVRTGRVNHAYLFSGPRGTGKTTTARILAKALNCTNIQDGEPCCECESCVQVQRGTSLDVQELDAASNNGVDAMRDLVSRAALGTPGRWKVYIVDEVHMLSNAASNTLLKTLEEPPAHVVFVLATTDPQKVLPTIRSRTQHLEFRLISAEVLGQLLADVNAAAGLDVAPEAIDLVVRRGKGSARDALSALDQVAAAGEVDDADEATDEIVEALCERDAGRALMAVAQACSAGRDARRLAEDLLGHLRNAFLATMARSLVMLPDDAAVAVEEQGRRLGAAGITRAVDEIGAALADMREALDPRVSLEVALVRLTRADADTSVGALLERIERLERGTVERGTAGASAPAAPGAEAPSPTEAATPKKPAAAAATPVPANDPAPPPAPVASGGPGAAEARAALATVRGVTTKPKPSSDPQPATGAPPIPPPAPPKVQSSANETPANPEPTAKPEPAAGPSAGGPSRDDLVKAWGDTILTTLKPGAKARFAAGRFVSVDGDEAVFALPNAAHRDQCEAHRTTVEGAIAAHFGRPLKIRLAVDSAEGASAPETPSAPGDSSEEDLSRAQVEQLEVADTAVTSPEQRLREAFPGAEEVTP